MTSSGAVGPARRLGVGRIEPQVVGDVVGDRARSESRRSRCRPGWPEWTPTFIGSRSCGALRRRRRRVALVDAVQDARVPAHPRVRLRRDARWGRCTAARSRGRPSPPNRPPSSPPCAPIRGPWARRGSTHCPRAAPGPAGPDASQPVALRGPTRHADVHSQALPFAAVEGSSDTRRPASSLGPQAPSAAVMHTTATTVAIERLRMWWWGRSPSPGSWTMHIPGSPTGRARPGSRWRAARRRCRWKRSPLPAPCSWCCR